MTARVSIARVPVHAMTSVFPLGLWIWAFFARIVQAISGSMTWEHVATYSMAAGLITGAAAMVPGLIDLLAMPPHRARALAVWHMIINVIVLTLLAIALFMRLAGATAGTPWVLDVIGIVLLCVGAWLGWHLVYFYRVGVERPADTPGPSVERP